MADNLNVTAGSGSVIGMDEVVDATLGTVKVGFGKIMDGTLDSSNKLIVNSSGEALTHPTANSQVDVNKLAGTTTDTNSGNKSAGTLRVVLATDQPALTNKILVTPDLPTGAATAAKQPALGTAGSASADVITVQGVASMTALKTDSSGVTQPVSAASLPLPTGASTAAKQPALGTAGTPSADVITVQGATSMTALKTDGSGVTQPVSASSLPLPTGAATSTKQSDGSQKSQIVDGSGNIIASTANALNTKPQMASADFWPYYNRMDIGGGPVQTDVAGALITRGAVTTDEGTGRSNFTGSSVTRSLGTCTFTNGSAVVTGSGFVTTDVHYLDWVKLGADSETAYAQVAFVNSDTQITLFTTYTGTGGTGASVVSQIGTITGTGTTISVGSGQLTLAAGTNTSATVAVYRGLSDGPSFAQTSLSISQRVANQDIYVGAETQITGTVQSFSRFHFTSTTNTQVITETGYNPTGGPTSSEQETNTITLPGAANTASLNTYRIEQQYDKIVFYINNVIVATHTKRIPHVTYEAQNAFYFDIRAVNSGSVTNTNIVVDYLYTKNYDRLDVYQSSLSQVQLTDGTTNAGVTTSAALKTDMTSVSGTAADVNSGTKSAGTLRVVLATDQPQLTNKLLVTPDANSAVNVAQINGVAALVGNGTTGTGSQRVTIASDNTPFPVKTDQTTHGTTDLVAADITKIAGTSIVNGGVAGSQSIGGTVATNVAITANPVNLGVQAVSSENSAVTTARQVQLVADLVGKLIVLPYANPENFVSGAITSAMTGTTTTSLIAAPAAGLRNYITQITVSNSHATVGTDVIIQDGSGGTTLYTIPAAAVYGGAALTFPTPLRQPTTATAIFCANVTTGASTKVSASGYKGA